MRLKGKIVTWNERKAFGFIRLLQTKNTNKDIFVHTSDIKNLRRSPQVGDLVTFSLTEVERGRKRAADAVIPAAQHKAKNNTVKEYNILLAILFSLFLISCYLAKKVEAELVLGYLVFSMITFIVYYFDKKSSLKRSTARTSEQTLLLLGLFGGWPGSIIAQQFLRHKSSKKAFRRLFWLTVILNILALTLYLHFK